MSKQNLSVAEASLNLEVIENLYDLDFRGAEERKMVEDFIRAHPELMPLLQEAHEVVRTYFPDASPFLDIAGLYDGPEHYYIVVNIRTTLKAKEAVERRAELDDNWLFPLPYNKRKIFDIGLYFV